MNRGDIVIVPFPFQDRTGEKIRPALVVQADAENRRLANTVLAMVTGLILLMGWKAYLLVHLPIILLGTGASALFSRYRRQSDIVSGTLMIYMAVKMGHKAIRMLV